MENKIDIFENYILEETQFENPLENNFFLYYLTYNNVPYDDNKLYNDPSYSQALYNDYFDHLILEFLRPNFPPIINVEEYVNENEKFKKIKDMTTFSLSRNSEPENVKDHYKSLSEEIKKLHNNRVENYINRKRSSEDDYGEMSSKKIKDMTTRNGGNAFIIFRKQLNEHLRSLGYNLNMQEHSKIASYIWSKQSMEVKSHFKEHTVQMKKMLNDQLKQLFCKSNNDNGTDH
ncbi:hypothetical protein RirG_001490 [Rhizophagus irregularis DAOM 197198w]|uniref:HMG box domain-containing protein n=1 Tax=Rhizophagus irregularis (strain DAOM 197198w) TaxID=1432141 RepID=A0A015NK96_RHIIW|nr:hypothetical protein RirG_001490 [Rhizophagus irregularis DAOM 197198w]